MNNSLFTDIGDLLRVRGIFSVVPGEDPIQIDQVKLYLSSSGNPDAVLTPVTVPAFTPLAWNTLWNPSAPGRWKLRAVAIVDGAEVSAVSGEVVVQPSNQV